MNFDELFINPNGNTSRAHYVPALLIVIAVIAFYAYIVTGRNAEFCILTLMYPAFTLLARRLRDMGQSPTMLLVPLVIVLLAFDVRFGYFSMGEVMDGFILWIALVVTAAFMLWGCVSHGKPDQAPE